VVWNTLLQFTLRTEGTLTAAVVICTRYRPEFLRDCLKGIAAWIPHQMKSLWSTTPWGTGKLHLRPVNLARNTWLSRARNRALRECTSEIVAYLDDDAVPDQRWLQRILDPFADPHVAIVTGLV
jgi:glycosyltransferase involved in cell wall biosynthesis